jgi:hypothetical protein
VPQSILQVPLAQQSLPLTQERQATQLLREPLFMPPIQEQPFILQTLELLYIPSMLVRLFTQQTQEQLFTLTLLELPFMESMLELPFTQPTLELLSMPQMLEQPFTLTPLGQPHHQLTQAHTLLMGLMLLPWLNHR